jgi:hypothetical protein
MKRSTLVLLLAVLVAAVALPTTAGATPHKTRACPKGKHLNKRHKCVKSKSHVKGVSAESEPGPRGPKGEPGAAGPQGAAGAPGAKGDNGSNGTNGTNGEDGAPGSPGSPGATGPVGPTGPTGPTGPQGPQGEPPAPSSVVYDNIDPASLVDNPVSLGYAATSSTEFGTQIVSTEATTDPEVEVLMSVWACETGTWNSGCVTSDPLATFPATLTLNVYEVGSENQPGALVSTVTSTFNLHYRPTADPTCGSPTQYRATDGKCFNGSPQPVVFDLSGSLPRKAVVSVKFTPSGPTDSLNVALEGPPSVGSNPTEAISGTYWDSAFYGSGSGVFHYAAEPSEWSPGEDAIAAKVMATN